MKAFVINLDHRTDRMKSFNKNKFPFEVERVSGLLLENPGIGNTQSQLNIMKEQEEFPFVIFEDDCVMLQPWSVVELAMSQLPPDWDALWLGATLTHYIPRYSPNLFRLKTAYTTHAIIYNSQAMIDYILDYYNKMSIQYVNDVFYYKEIEEKFNCFITYPICATQYGSMSDVFGTFQPQTVIVESYKKFTRT